MTESLDTSEADAVAPAPGGIAALEAQAPTDERAMFEAWAEKEGIVIWLDEIHDIMRPTAGLAFLAWKAGRALLAAQPEQHGWISTAEKMPPVGEEVLVWAETPLGYGRMLDCWDEQREAPVSFSSATIPVGLGWDSGNSFEQVSHWMHVGSPDEPTAQPEQAKPEAKPVGASDWLQELESLVDAHAEIANRNGVEFVASNEPDLEGELAAKHAILEFAAAQLLQEQLRIRDALQTDAYAEGRRDEQNELASVLPGTIYMDPPDGGAPTILEQLMRQAKDAARYRWLRDRLLAVDFSWGKNDEPVLIFRWPPNLIVGGNFDQNIDAAIPKTRGAV